MDDEHDESASDNDTLAALLRKLEDGKFQNHAGAKVQRLFSRLRKLAATKGSRATGTITITIKIPMGKDGYANPVAAIECKAPKIARDESLIFVDAEGTLLSRPVERQLSLDSLPGGRSPATKEPESAEPVRKGI